MKKVLLGIACGLLANAALAGDIAAGAALAKDRCAVCHTESGISQVPIYPNLAGQKEIYLGLALEAYKGQQRKGGNAAIMWGIAGALSGDDIKNLAAFYASLPAGK